MKKNSENTSQVILESIENPKDKQILFSFKKLEKVVESSDLNNQGIVDSSNIEKDRKESKTEESSLDEESSLSDQNSDKSLSDIQLKSSTVAFKNLKLDIATGEKNFDPNDLPGHDSSAKNDIVRTWDKVIYNYSFSIQSTDSSKTYSNIRYKVNASYKNARQVVDGQVRDYAYFPEGSLTGTNASTTRDANFETSGTLSSSSSIVDSSVNLQVLGATPGYNLLPTITITIIDAIDTDTGKTVTINSTSSNLVTKSTRVSAKPNVKAEIANSINDYQLMSTLTDDYTLNSMMKTLGIKFSIVPLTDDGITRSGSLYEQLFGATYPQGEIKVDVEANTYFKNHAGSIHNIVYGTDQRQPEITHYGLLYSANANTDKLTKTDAGNLHTFKNMKINGVWNMPASVDMSTGKRETASVYNSNEVFAENKNKSTFTYAVTSPAAIHREGLTGFSNTSLENVGKSTFATVASVVAIPYDYLLDKAGTIYTDFKTTTIEYADKKEANDSTYTYQRGNTLPGSIICYTPSYDLTGKKIGLNPSNQSWTPSGNGAVYENEKFMSEGIYDGSSLEMKYITGITEWNGNSFELDTTREVRAYIAASQTASGKVNQVYYGVAKSVNQIPDLIVQHDNMNSRYVWFTSITEAKKSGKITAVKTIFEKTGIEASLKARTRIPLTAIGPTNNQAKDKLGNPNVIISSNATHRSSMNVIATYPFKSNGTYSPTKYDENNNLTSHHTPANLYGDTLLIVPFTARIAKSAIRTSYNSDEVIQWQITPTVAANENDTVTFSVKDTLPKELQYISGSSKYGTQNIEPTIKVLDSGATELTWTINYHKNDAPRQTLTFDSMVNGKNILYDATNTKNVTNTATISAKNQDGLKDDSIEELRTATGSTTITKVTTTVIEKSTKTRTIEIGSNDEALTNKESNTTIDYSLYFKNESKTPSKDTNILDILPRNSDGRGTTFAGNFDLISMKITTSNGSVGKAYYSKQEIPMTTEPNDVDPSLAWSVYNNARVDNVKALFIAFDELKVGESVSVDIQLVSKNQKAGDILVNSAKLDNYNYSPVQSVFVKTSVISRTFKGIAWYDDNLDGRKNFVEAVAANIPVKLYRTSIDNKSYKNQRVTENLTKQKFVDSSGNSTIITNAKGEYTFSNLPEGEYIAFFEVEDRVEKKEFKITEKDSLVSSQAVDTSKVNIDTYKTDNYSAPSMTTGNFPNNEWVIKNVNIGLIRSSQIRLFKYETGSAVDANKDGKLSDVEKATGTALAGAEFDIYTGDRKEKVGSAKTDSSGKLTFEFLFPGDYTLVETKAPVGYELVKEPIAVKVSEGNEVVMVYQEDDKVTVLPFTGGNGPIQLFLMGSGSLMVLGLLGIAWHYRTPRKKGEY